MTFELIHHYQLILI